MKLNEQEVLLNHILKSKVQKLSQQLIKRLELEDIYLNTALDIVFGVKISVDSLIRFVFGTINVTELEEAYYHAVMKLKQILNKYHIDPTCMYLVDFGDIVDYPSKGTELILKWDIKSIQVESKQEPMIQLVKYTSVIDSLGLDDTSLEENFYMMPIFESQGIWISPTLESRDRLHKKEIGMIQNL